ncbi:ABC transporter ATP-binding protein [Deinococcus sp. HMF7604]|uniref:ABC transporter ATP-binding protein n=1 Tax=Deinococcus betulae TaxID=2873312 RepID=UPI001CCD7FF1|nr:ABC transporter ATP-binding protein [Deinococcus betulae]MBZ9749657.1 ABC transporter ATP-binding protein [Deinococcus betulae]
MPALTATLDGQLCHDDPVTDSGAPPPPPDTAPPALRLRGVTKRFPGVVANDRVDLTVQPGEVLALLGENGAGKSTLISMLYGLYQPDEGHIEVTGRAVCIGSPAQARRLGIGLVPQHPLLVARHTVAENLALGRAGGLFPARRVAGHIRALSAQYGLEVDPGARVADLSPGEKQRVEIIRALLGGAQVLILDEPTSVLTPQEAQGLFRVMRELRAGGRSLIFISHKLDEVLDVADRVTVLRKGQVVGGVPTAGATRESLAALMVGRAVDFTRKRAPGAGSTDPLLSVRGLDAQGTRGLPALRGVSFDLRRGEVLGVAGIAGNGQSELVEVLAGVWPATGEVSLNGQPLSGSAAERSRAGVAHIPEDRLHSGTVPSMTVAENLSLRDYDRAPLARGLARNLAAEGERARRDVEAYAVATPSIHTPVRLLSGGNIQKLILARELAGAPLVILAVHPTYGLDIGAADQVHRALLDRTGEGAGVLLVSEDLDELLSLSDRVGVMVGGALLGPFPVAEVTRESLGLLMGGAHPHSLPGAGQGVAAPGAGA